MRTASRRKRYVIASLISLGMALALLLERGTFSKTEAAQLWQDLSDAFFVPGVMLTGIGGLVFVAGNGIFDMLNFGVRKVLLLLRSEKHRAAFPRTYYDYLQTKADRSNKGQGFLIVVGGIMLALSGLFVLMHLSITGG